MNIGIIGLGRMGSAAAQRLLHAGHGVYGFDINPETKRAAAQVGIRVVDTLQEVAKNTVLLFFVPAGNAVGSLVAQLQEHVLPDAVFVDCGNSYFKDSIRYAKQLAMRNIYFLDCGTSGGIHGLEHGFCLMIGGEKKIYEKLRSIWDALAAKNGHAHVGPAGAGHYVKMVHNGIEYALMQAYAEGFHLLHETTFNGNNFDLAQITTLWNHGSVIRSFLLQLSSNIFTHDQQLEDVSGKVSQLGTGKWAVECAHEKNVPLNLIEQAVKIRELSQETGGNYATKVVALLREQFGGHAVERNSREL